MRKVTVVVALDLGCGTTKNSEYESNRELSDILIEHRDTSKECSYFLY